MREEDALVDLYALGVLSSKTVDALYRRFPVLYDRRGIPSSYSRIRGRRRRGGKGVRGTREEIYAAKKTLSREFEDEEFRTREWFHAKNLDLSASALGMSPVVVDAMMGDGDDVPPESKLLEQCVEDMDEKVKREMFVVAFADRERRRRISRDGGGEVTTRHLRESVYDRKIRRVVARSGVESGQKRRSRIRQTNGGTKDGNRRVHRGIRVFERCDDEAEDNDGDSFSSRNSDNSTRTRISGNTGKVLKRADVAAIAGLSLFRRNPSHDRLFSRSRDDEKKSCASQSIKAFDRREKTGANCQRLRRSVDGCGCNRHQRGEFFGPPG